MQKCECAGTKCFQLGRRNESVFVRSQKRTKEDEKRILCISTFIASGRLQLLGLIRGCLKT